MIAIIDYGMGNLASVLNAFRKMNIPEVAITPDPADIMKADKIVLPGVSAFEDTMKNLERNKMIGPIIDFIKKGRPFLGMCLGMQLLFERSHENGVFEGLGIFRGDVVRFEHRLPIPQIGWNQANLTKKSVFFDNLPQNAYFYFDHSYYPVPLDPDIIAAKTHYGIEYVSAIVKDNICAVQFHPEKSHNNGLKIIKNFGLL